MIRPGTLDDADAMAEIFSHYVRTSPVIFSNTELSGADMRSKLQRLEVGSRFPFFVAEDGGRVTGYAYAHLWQPDEVYSTSWELTIYLNHECLGRGTGSALLRHIIDACRRGGAHTLVAFITDGNTPSERMVERAGFFRAGCLPQVGYKFGQYFSDAFYELILE